MELRERLKYYDEEIILAEGFDAACIGVGVQFNMNFAIYDYNKCIDILVSRDGVSREEAAERMDFYVIGSYVGDRTPVFLMPLSEFDA